jgi:hypothetical protein
MAKDSTWITMLKIIKFKAVVLYHAENQTGLMGLSEFPVIFIGGL